MIMNPARQQSFPSSCLSHDKDRVIRSGNVVSKFRQPANGRAGAEKWRPLIAFTERVFRDLILSNVTGGH